MGFICLFGIFIGTTEVCDTTGASESVDNILRQLAEGERLLVFPRSDNPFAAVSGLIFSIFIFQLVLFGY